MITGKWVSFRNLIFCVIWKCILLTRFNRVSKVVFLTDRLEILQIIKTYIFLKQTFGSGFSFCTLVGRESEVISIIAHLFCVSSLITIFNDVTYLQCISFSRLKLCEQKVSLLFWLIGV